MDAAVVEALGGYGGVRVDLRARGLTDSDAARLADLLGAGPARTGPRNRLGVQKALYGERVADLSEKGTPPS